MFYIIALWGGLQHTLAFSFSGLAAGEESGKEGGWMKDGSPQNSVIDNYRKNLGDREPSKCLIDRAVKKI